MNLGKAASSVTWARSWNRACTKFGQGPVNGVHSLENTCTYNLRFSIDWKNRRSTTRSFFDSFLVFPVGAASGAQAKSLS